MLVDLPLSVIIDLIQQVDSCLFSLLPFFLLLLFLLHTLNLNQLVQLLLVGHQILVSVLHACQGSLGLLAFLLLHLLLVFAKLTFLLHDSLDHLPISLFFFSQSLLFLQLDALVLFVDGQMNSLLFLSNLNLFLLDKVILLLPFLLQHLLFLQSQVLFLVFLAPLQLLLNCQDGITFLYFFLLLLLFQPFDFFLLLEVSLVELCKQHLFYIKRRVHSY